MRRGGLSRWRGVGDGGLLSKQGASVPELDQSGQLLKELIWTLAVEILEQLEALVIGFAIPRQVALPEEKAEALSECLERFGSVSHRNSTRTPGPTASIINEEILCMAALESDPLRLTPTTQSGK